MKYFNDYIVNVRNLKKNVINIKARLAKRTKLCAIVKADAYGMGSEVVCKSLYGFADYFGVSCLSEALDIRVFDKDTPIIILGMVNVSDIDLCAKNNIDISVSTLEALKEIKKSNQLINVHIQINTGLNRYGIRNLTEFKQALKLIDDDKNINLVGIYSHFATKSNDKLFINIQFFKFLQFRNLVKNRGVICHIANSCATIISPKYHLDMVRNGFSMYAYNEDLKNLDVLTIKSKIVNILNLKKNDSVGYDRTFVAKKRMKIAVVPLGYADGYDRRLSNKASVIINNHKCPIVGLICMDVFMVDVSDIDVSLGDEVVIIGRSATQKITVFDLAKILETSPYEILLKFNRKRMNYVINK